MLQFEWVSGVLATGRSARSPKRALRARQTLLRRLRDWFAAVERYPRQLHEMGRDEYLSMQRRELARQQAASVEAN